MKSYLEVLTKVPEWAAKLAFIILVVIVADMYLRANRSFRFGDSLIGFLEKKELQQAIAWEPRSETIVNYPYGAWVNTTKDANCEPGFVVTGVSVIYGGTCQEKCSPDGGIVKQIQLKCGRLITNVPPELPSGG